MNPLVPIPDYVSYDTLLCALIRKPIDHLTDEELEYFLELMHRLRELKETTETDVWWFRYYR